VIPLALWPYWPWIRKALPYVAALAAVGGLIWYIASLRGDVAELTARLAAQDAQYRAQVTYERQTTADTVRDYEAELERLRAVPPVVRRVRVCVDPAVPGGGTAAGGAGAPGEPGGDGAEVPGGTPVGPDIRPGLQRIADAYDIRNAQVRHLLERHRKLSEMASRQQ
jgi:hypothetical protein